MNPAARSRDELVRHLVDSRIAGDVATPRASNVANITKMLDGRWDYHFGLQLDRDWAPADVLKVLADRVGMDPDLDRVDGGDRIDPELTLAALDEAAALIADAAARRARVLVATGHPTGVLSWHLAVAGALAAAGCRVLTPAAGAPVRADHLHPRAHVRYLGGVAMLSNGADFLHTHAAEPMQLMLADGTWPDLVVADHGWAGAAAQAGIPTIGLADTNDPALFVGAEEGKVAVAVPLDDNVAPDLYQPLAGHVLRHLRSTGGG
jgi:hypothetical protein